MAANDVPYEFVQAGGYLGPKFIAVFFFENVFWRVAIPIVYATPSVNIMSSLVAMPGNLKQHLVQNARILEEFKVHWADCIDYDQRPPLSHDSAAERSSDRTLYER